MREEKIRVDLYLTVRLKGLRASFGQYAWLVECGKRDGTVALREDVMEEGNATRNLLEAMALYRALEILKKPCRIRVHVRHGCLEGAINGGWLEQWERTGFRNARGKPVRNGDIWQAVSQALKGHETEVLPCMEHKYTREQEQKIDDYIREQQRKWQETPELLCREGIPV